MLRRNAHYGGRRPAHVDKVVWTIGESLDARIRLTEQNRIDHCVDSFLPSAISKTLERRYGVNWPGRFFVTRACRLGTSR